MISVRQASYIASGVAVILTALTAWLIIGSPGTVDGPRAYAPQPTPGEAVEVSVDPGESPSAIAEKLELAGVIDSGTRFRILVQLMGYDRLLQAGTYDLQRGMPALEVINRMRNGIVTTRSVTVVEGWQLGEIADAVADFGIARDDFLAAAESHEYNFAFVGQIPAGESLQGYLYPATYPLRATDTGESVVERMLQGFDANVPADTAAQAETLGLSLHAIVTLASIIEREATVAEEKPIMAQVFLSRLAAGLLLNADPTVQFAVHDAGLSEDYWKTGLTEDDLVVDSPYNTYLYAGLPPGPIGSPAADTIAAVLNPSATKYFYFVAKPDGTHAFAETLAEHQANIDMYLNGAGQ
jgi:UPF0755 protein